MRCTYVIESGKDGQWYTGVTSDLKALCEATSKGKSDQLIIGVCLGLSIMRLV